MYILVHMKMSKNCFMTQYYFPHTFRYASLYFCAAIEQDDNELITLEIIHRYVELLDKYFGSVSSITVAHQRHFIL